MSIKSSNVEVFQSAVVNVPVDLRQVSFINFSSKQKKKKKEKEKLSTWNSMASSYHSKVRPTQKMGVPFFCSLRHEV